ncbi:hypothetical protein EYC84_005910 [Monilinia fructicola]|uniref:Uncharacterized protein n=1 Tax=Monilinia fructicola TaxID=38448 RepID=A0A5M9K6L9_MONFR|nr:hypothetical protein EYC84_005910 [Monilinia fructicola]
MDWFVAKGEEITKDISRIIVCTQSYIPGVDTVVESIPYECSLAEPPEFNFCPGVKVVGRVQSNMVEKFNFGNNVQTSYNANLGHIVY